MPDYRVKRSMDAEDLPEVVERVVDALAGARTRNKRRRVLRAATAGQRMLAGYYLYWDDVANGGHAQYFWNYTGNYWKEALAAARVIGLSEEAILAEAISLFPKMRPRRSKRRRRSQLKRISKRELAALDNRFAILDDKSYLLVRAYITEHPDEFFLPLRPHRVK